MLERLLLVHPAEEACGAFRFRFGGLPNVEVVCGRFEELPPHDCFVTAGNSYGLMTAGIDAAVVRRFGPELMERVQSHILNEYFGEQPVGTAFVVPTGDEAIPYVAHAPTMRTPGGIEGTDKVYNATWAALLAILAHNRTGRGRIDSVAMPMMGAGFGGVPYTEAARQMAAAYRHLWDPPHRLEWDHVILRERAICYDGDRKVVRG